MYRIATFAFLTCVLTSPAAAELRGGGKLSLTDGVTSIEGAAGGGLATWALIGGRATDAGIGGGAHVSHVRTARFELISFGAKIGLYDRVELSWARQRFDLKTAGAELGLGRDFTLGQHVFGAKLRVVGDAVYDEPWLPQIAVGIQHKIADEGATLRAVGARKSRGTDFYLSATKVVLEHGLVIGATARLTRANQFGLLGFGGDKKAGHSLEFEGSIGKLVTPRLLMGVEYRTKPDNLSFAKEQDAIDLFAAYSAFRNVNLTLAYVDLGSVATYNKQRGMFVSLQGAF